MSSEISYVEENGVHTFSMPWGRQNLILQTGVYAPQASAACTLQYGDTVVLATTVMGNSPRQGIDYFPLLVDYEEKFYASGKIKGSRFIKREGRPSDEAVLSGRIIDRSIRPFFDPSSRVDVQIVVSTLSWDEEHDPSSLGISAAAAALHTSEIPWDGPVVGVRLSYKDGDWNINPTYEERSEAELDLLVSVRDGKAVMIEADGQEAKEDIIVKGVEKAIEAAEKVNKLMVFMREKVGIDKKDMTAGISEEEKNMHQDLTKYVFDFSEKKYMEAFGISDKKEISKVFAKVKEDLIEDLKKREDIGDDQIKFAVNQLEEVLLKVTKYMYLKEGKRIDGRGFDEIRALSARVGVLPRTHGTGLFQRGETQALTVLTLGSPSDEQILDTMELSDVKKRYMHHYNFPGYSVGEVRPNRGASRREIGHGALAEKALERMIPNKESFPYTIRLVSEIMSSNGSSSMASTCGSTLALMDAGVPIKSPVAGIAMGIITDNDRPTEDYRIMTDIQGLEDHYGEMDFKITGTDQGVTAIQLDVKNSGVTSKMTAETLEQARVARLQILDVIKQTIPEPRKELSQYAPRITSFKIDPDKIRLVIGPGGKMINEIVDKTGVKIDIEDDGLVMITSKDSEEAARAAKWVHDIVRDLKSGESFEDAKVSRIFPFGAMAEVLPGKEGLIHISELAPWRVGKVEDVVNVGDIIPVKVIEIDGEGRANLSLKQTDYEYPPEVKAKAQEASTAPRTGSDGHGGDRNGSHSGSSGRQGSRGGQSRRY